MSLICSASIELRMHTEARHRQGRAPVKLGALCRRSRRGGMGVDFVAVVDQVIALLRQRGRLTYRTLQLQFQLDEVHLEALKDELIYGQRVAVDEEGRVLVWTCDERPGVSPGVIHSALLETGPVLPAAPMRPASQAERRQLTV